MVRITYKYIRIHIYINRSWSFEKFSFQVLIKIDFTFSGVILQCHPSYGERKSTLGVDILPFSIFLCFPFPNNSNIPYTCQNIYHIRQTMTKSEHLRKPEKRKSICNFSLSLALHFLLTQLTQILFFLPSKLKNQIICTGVSDSAPECNILSMHKQTKMPR